MYITLEADYAVRIVDCLAQGKKRLDAKTISGQTGVTLRFALKILRKLVAEGIVCSFKGTRGGYELAQKPEDITLGQVIEIVDGPIVFCRCVGKPDYVCNRGEQGSLRCKFNQTYAELAEMVQAKMNQITFANT